MDLVLWTEIGLYINKVVNILSLSRLLFSIVVCFGVILYLTVSKVVYGCRWFGVQGGRRTMAAVTDYTRRD